jgi:natural product biosynthesis luciferase-like monooxygenase protein
MGNDRFSGVLIGEQSLLVQCGEILLRGGHAITAVVTDDAAIVRWSKAHSLPVLPASADLAQELVGEPFDYLFSITNLAILPVPVLALPARMAINFHDGPLPRYAGLNAPAWALLHGESEYGVTFHEMRAEVDEGAILEQRLFEIAPDDTSLTLNTKCFEAGIDAFGDLVGKLSAAGAEPIAQDLSAKSFFGKYDRPAAFAFIDFASSAKSIDALVRALDFGDRYDNPLAAAKLGHSGRTVVVRALEIVEAEGAPGAVLAADDSGITIACADGAVRLKHFATVFGDELAPSDAAAHLGLAVGDVVAPMVADSKGAAAAGELAGRLARSEAFWLRRLSTLDPVDIPYLTSIRNEDGQAEFASSELRVPEALSGRGCDLVAGAVAACLGRLGGQVQFHLGFRDPQLAELVGGRESWLAETIPLLVRTSPGATITDFFAGFEAELERVRKRGTWLNDAVGRSLSPDRKTSLASGGLTEVALEIGDVDQAPALRVGTRVLFRIHPDASRIRCDYDGRAIADQAAADLTDRLQVFLEAVAQAGEADLLARVPLLSESERARVLVEWNDTSVDFPRDRCIHELIAEQAASTPDAEAVVFEDVSYSYSELDSRANRLAAHLRERGVGPDRLVGIYVDRSLDMLVAMLGVLKAGGGYVPLDPSYPADRIALMIEDSGLGVVITQEHRAAHLPGQGALVVRIDGEWEAIAQHPDECPESGVGAENLAYMIYTSGSTGRPKGVMVEHRNVVNFFAGMDERVACDGPGVWLAVTSLSFDISVLELLYTLARGFKVVLYSGESSRQVPKTSSQPIDFGLFMWGADEAQGPSKYELMLESAKFGDTHGFSSFWTPERHFHAFGGPYPNPSVTSAAIAAVTDRIAIRAGSCVSPLHHPIRIAEEWAVVDNLSKGRVGMAFAAGWQPNDFVIRPENHKDAKGQMFRDVETVKRLWRGESVDFENPMGQNVPTSTQPRPIQPELPVWITTAGNPESFRQAGEAGANLLTHLLGQTVEELAEKIALYRQGRKDAGYDPDAGVVTLMLHTLVAQDDESAKVIAAEPMKSYLRSSAALVKGFAWAFPAFKRPGGSSDAPDEIDLDSLTDDEMNAILDFAFERYFETSGLFGSVASCLAQVERVKGAGVDEIGCLIDYGVPTDVMLESLKLLDQVREGANANVRDVASELDQSLPAQVARHGVSHMQCTPSMARMLVLDRDSHAALQQIQHLMIGGEAFPLSLAHELDMLAGGSVTNMYGPTETTIWSSTAPVKGKPDAISIGTPIANTQLYVLDENFEPVPVGVEGELMIGGDGVVRGYHERPELTERTFVADPFRGEGARMYRTGDLARFNADGSVHYVGRMDHQVKLRGYRIELGEVEVRLAAHDAIEQCIVIVREDAPGDQRLVAYAVAGSAEPGDDALRAHLAATLPEFMLPSAFCFLEELPLTPNGKIDRSALPAPEQLMPRSNAVYQAPQSDLECRVAECWKAVLKLEDVGTNDNFFDLGGHSLLIVQVHRQLREEVDKPISLTDLYRFPTIHSLVEHLEGDGGAVAASTGEDRGEKRKAALARRRRRGGRA